MLSGERNLENITNAMSSEIIGKTFGPIPATDLVACFREALRRYYDSDEIKKAWETEAPK